MRARMSGGDIRAVPLGTRMDLQAWGPIGEAEARFRRGGHSKVGNASMEEAHRRGARPWTGTEGDGARWERADAPGRMGVRAGVMTATGRPATGAEGDEGDGGLVRLGTGVSRMFTPAPRTSAVRTAGRLVTPGEDAGGIIFPSRWGTPPTAGPRPGTIGAPAPPGEAAPRTAGQKVRMGTGFASAIGFGRGGFQGPRRRAGGGHSFSSADATNLREFQMGQQLKQEEYYAQLSKFKDDNESVRDVTRQMIALGKERQTLDQALNAIRLEYSREAAAKAKAAGVIDTSTRSMPQDGPPVDLFSNKQRRRHGMCTDLADLRSGANGHRFADDVVASANLYNGMR